MAKPMKKARKIQTCRSVGNQVPDLMELQDRERRRIAQPSQAQEAARVEEVEGQDAEQHEHRAEQGVQEELDRRIELARAAPDADEEVHRHQHDLPEHIEQEEVQGHEHAEHAGLQEEQEDVIFLLPVLMAFQEDRKDRNPSKVVSRTRSRAMPSIPNSYRAPIDAIQGWLSRNWKRSPPRSNSNQSGTDRRKSSSATPVAKYRMNASVLRDEEENQRPSKGT